MYRLIAEKGKILVNGESETPCIDTDSPDDWGEKEATTEEQME